MGWLIMLDIQWRDCKSKCKQTYLSMINWSVKFYILNTHTHIYVWHSDNFFHKTQIKEHFGKPEANSHIKPKKTKRLIGNILQKQNFLCQSAAQQNLSAVRMIVYLGYFNHRKWYLLQKYLLQKQVDVNITTI